MRSGGRLENAEYLPHDVKYPNHLTSRELGNQADPETLHGKGNHTPGANQTLVMLFSRFWLM